MFLGRVIGRLVSTKKLDGFTGHRFLLVRPVDEHGEDAGDVLVANDTVDSGPGDLVHVCDGKEAAMAFPDSFIPSDATIVGHVEQFETGGEGDDGRARGSGRRTGGDADTGPRGGRR